MGSQKDEPVYALGYRKSGYYFLYWGNYMSQCHTDLYAHINLANSIFLVPVQIQV